MLKKYICIYIYIYIYIRLNFNNYLSCFTVIVVIIPYTPVNICADLGKPETIKRSLRQAHTRG